jgi:hypothetical protein
MSGQRIEVFVYQQSLHLLMAGCKRAKLGGFVLCTDEVYLGTRLECTEFVSLAFEGKAMFRNEPAAEFPWARGEVMLSVSQWR